MAHYAKTWLTKEEWERLSGHRPIDLRDLLIIYVLYGCALRVSELCHLRVRDINLKERTIVLQKSKYRNKPLKKPLPKATAFWLKFYFDKAKPKKSNYLIYSHKGRGVKPICRETIAMSLWKLGVAAGIGKKVTPHTLRRSRATHLLDAGLPIEQVSRLLGHREIRSTMEYLDLTTGQLAAKLKKVDPLAR